MERLSVEISRYFGKLAVVGRRYVVVVAHPPARVEFKLNGFFKKWATDVVSESTTKKLIFTIHSPKTLDDLQGELDDLLRSLKLKKNFRIEKRSEQVLLVAF